MNDYNQFIENKVLQFIDFLIFFIAVIVFLFVWKSHTKDSLKRIVLWSFNYTN